MKPVSTSAGESQAFQPEPDPDPDPELEPDPEWDPEQEPYPELDVEPDSGTQPNSSETDQRIQDTIHQ